MDGIGDAIVLLWIMYGGYHAQMLVDTLNSQS